MQTLACVLPLTRKRAAINTERHAPMIKTGAWGNEGQVFHE